MARIREAQGDLDGALDLLSEAERLYVSDFFPNVRPVAALKARVWVAQGRVGEALGWAREQGLSVDGRPQLPARVRAHHPGQGAPGSVQERPCRRTLPAVRQWDSWSASCKQRKQGERTGSVIEILVVQALAHQSQGDIPAALVPLDTRPDAG